MGDSALKMAVRDNIPSARFLGHRFTKAQGELLETESQLPMPVSSWTINLSILWASDEITPCDMHQLSHLLADEIYNTMEAKEEVEEWLGKEEEKYEEKSLSSEWGDSEEEGYGSSEETSSEEYEEEAIADMMLGKEEEEEYPFHENDYDYMADVRGEYDEVEVEKEVEGLVDQ